MNRSMILGGILAVLALPGVAHADGDPTSADRANAAQECRYERGSTKATREAFAAKYRTFGKCVSTRARDESAERKDARSNGAETCKAERGTTAESRRFRGQVRHQRQQEERVRQVRLAGRQGPSGPGGRVRTARRPTPASTPPSDARASAGPPTRRARPSPTSTERTRARPTRSANACRRRRALRPEGQSARGLSDATLAA